MPRKEFFYETKEEMNVKTDQSVALFLVCIDAGVDIFYYKVGSEFAGCK